MAHDVFISYSSKDKAIADAVCARLEEKRLRVWIAPRDVPPGSDFAESIIDAIDTSKVFVLIWSADANASTHILAEVNEAFNKGIVIIPFRIQDVQPTRSFQYYIGRTHWLDALTQPLEQHIEKLAATITAVLRHGPGEGLPHGAWQAPIGGLESARGLPHGDENHTADIGHSKPVGIPVKPVFKPASILLIAGAVIGAAWPQPRRRSAGLHRRMRPGSPRFPDPGRRTAGFSCRAGKSPPPACRPGR